MYREIFEDRIYVRRGISLDDCSVVMDVGANIGLFTLFIKNLYPGSTIYAFEPAPDLFSILSLNVNGCSGKASIFQLGLSDKEGESVFTYYPKYSILSGFHADLIQEEHMLRSGAHNQQNNTRPDEQERLREHMDFLIKDKLSNKKELKCRLTTISSFIKDNNISRIDLLKVDAEKSEEDILSGINDEDWSKIRQVVMEVHCASMGQDSLITGRLKAKGFEVAVEEEPHFKGSGILNIYARRASA